MTATFPQVPLGAKCEIDLNGTWTDITSYVYYRDGVSINFGHPDENQNINPTSLNLTLNNRDGRFSPRNPTGPYYGNISRNTPMRYSVPESSSYLRLEQDWVSYISCPDNARLDVTGDIDLQIEIYPSSYTNSTLASKANFNTNEESWDLELNDNGTVVFGWSPTGNNADEIGYNSTLPIPFGHTAVRVTMAHATGTVTYYTASTIAGPWTQLGSSGSGSGGASTSIFNSTSPITLGYNPNGYAENSYTGKIYAFSMYNGIAGTLVASPTFNTQTAGITSFNDAQTNTWTIAGTAEISNRHYLAHVEVPAWPPSFDNSGTDIYDQIQGSGLMRRLTQGTPPVLSSMYRAYGLQTGSLACYGYWPCEDGLNSSTIASGLSGGSAMTFSGTPQFSSDSSFACTQPIPVLNSSHWRGSVNSWPSTWTSNSLRFLIDVPLAGDTDGAVIARMHTTGTVATLDMVYNSANGGTANVIGYGANGASLFSTGLVAANLNGTQNRVSMDLIQVGANITYDFGIYTINSNDTGFLSNPYSTATVGSVSSIEINPNSNLVGTAVGQVSVQANFDSDFSIGDAVNAHIGENAGYRFARLCTENNLSWRVYGSQQDTVAMGYQYPDTFPNLLQYCEDADKGLLYEHRDSLSLGYRTRVSMFNQTPKLVTSYTASQLSNPVTPTDDDLFIRNDITITNYNSSSYRLEQTYGNLSVNSPPNGVGDYSSTTTVFLANDNQLPDETGWYLWLGTIDDVRYSAITVDLTRPQMSSLFYNAQDVVVGDRITCSNTPNFLPPDGISQIVRGGSINAYGYTYNHSWVASPESAYEVAYFDDGLRGRADTDGSTLTGSITSTAISASFTTTSSYSPAWSTTPSDFPFDVEISGERCTVAGPGTLLGTDPFMVNGTASYSGTNCSIAASTTSGLPPVVTPYNAGFGINGVYEAYVDTIFVTPAGSPATNAEVFNAKSSPGSISTSTSYTFWAWVLPTVTRTYEIVVNWMLNGSYVSSSFGTGVSVPAGTWACVTGVITSPSSGINEVEIGIDDPNSPTAGQTFYTWGINGCATSTISAASPQTVTLIRSVNGVVKAQSSGTDVRLFQPGILTM